MNTHAQPIRDGDTPTADRTRRWVWTTLALQVGVLVAYPAFVCGCHFNYAALVLGMIPVGWAGFTLFASRSWKERAVAFVNALLIVPWLLLAWHLNIQFAFE